MQFLVKAYDGPDMLEKYRLDEKEITFGFVVK